MMHRDTNLFCINNFEALKFYFVLILGSFVFPHYSVNGQFLRMKVRMQTTNQWLIYKTAVIEYPDVSVLLTPVAISLILS